MEHFLKEDVEWGLHGKDRTTSHSKSCFRRRPIIYFDEPLVPESVWKEVEHHRPSSIEPRIDTDKDNKKKNK